MPESSPASPTLAADRADLVARCGDLPLPRLVEVLRVDQVQRWRAGQRLLAEAYLGAFPALAASAEDALVLIWGEVLLRFELAEVPRLEEYRARFPHHADALQVQFELQAHLDLPPDGAPLPPPPVPGYEILGQLGEGGMGVVYKARHLALNRLVALKLIKSGSDADPAEQARFRAEAEAVARLQHPNIVQIYEVGQAEGRPFLALEFLDGGNLAQKLRGGRLVVSQAVRLVEVLARAVQAAHDRGIVHRDLKPGNVLLGRDGTPKIGDFGLARTLDDGPGRTVEGDVLGTPSYMAPELAGGRSEAAGPAADVYGLGAILYELLTNRPPFRAATPQETVNLVVSRPPDPPRKAQPRTPPDLEAICLRCLAKDPAQRYPTAGQLARALAGCRELRRAEKDLPPPGPLTRAAGRHPLWTLAFLAFLPHVLGSLVNISFNALEIVGHLDRAQQRAFGDLVLGYNLLVYPVCFWLFWRLVVPVARSWRALDGSPAPPAPPVAAARHRVLSWARWGVGLACLGWLPGGLLFPAGISVLAGRVPAAVFGRFLISFTLAGLIALTYSFFGIEFVALRVFYPRLWVDVEDFRAVTRRELAGAGPRLRLFQFWAGVIPLAGAALMVGFGAETTRVQGFRLLVLSLIVLGIIGFAVALAVNGVLSQTLAALTGNQPRPPDPPSDDLEV